MAFTLSGSTITQAGTETSLGGLSGIAGVITYTLGNKIHYVFPNGTRLVVDGTLSHDPDAEVLVFSEVATSSSAILVTGTYNFGKEYTKSGATRYSQGLGIINKKTLGATNGFNAIYLLSAVVRTSGSSANFVWKGGQIQSPTMLTNGGGTFDIYDGTFICDYNSTNLNNPPSIVIQSASTVNNFRGLKLYSPPSYPGILFQWEKSPDIFTDVIMTNGSGMGTSGTTLDVSSGVALPIVINNFTSIAGDNDLTFWRQNYIRAINYFKGSDVVTKGMLPVPIAQNVGLVEVYKESVFTIKNASNIEVDNANIICRDTDNGFRNADYRGYSWVDDRVYLDTTNSSGVTPTITVLLLASVKTGNTDPNLGIIKDYRGKLGDTTDLFDFFVNHYLYKQQTITAELKGTGIGNYSTNIFDDENVTLSETLAVAKLDSSFSVNSGTNTITVTDNSTLDDLYDVMKAWKTRNVQAQLEYPTIATQPVNANGTNLVTAMDIVGIEFLTSGTKFKTLEANSTANGAISDLSIIGDVNQATPTSLSNVTISGTLTYNTNTDTSIGISNNTSIGTIENSGTGIVTITSDNNSTITTYTDAEINFLNSTATVHLPSGFDEFGMYSTSADALSQTNALFSGTALSNSISYKAELYGGQTVYIRPIDNDVAGDIVIMPQVVPIGIGNYDFTVVAFSESNQLNTLIAQINSLTTKIDTKPTLAQIEATTVLSKKADTDLLLKSSDYIEPHNSNIDSIKTTVESLVNYDDTLINSKLNSIKDKTDILTNTDLSGITDDLTVINNNVKLASLLIPATENI